MVRLKATIDNIIRNASIISGTPNPKPKATCQSFENADIVIRDKIPRRIKVIPT